MHGAQQEQARETLAVQILFILMMQNPTPEIFICFSDSLPGGILYSDLIPETWECKFFSRNF